MSYELSADHLAARERAREFANEQLIEEAAAIDRAAAIPAAILRETARVATTDDPIALVVIVEELAAVSAAVAAAAALQQKSGVPSQGLTGLRGAAAADHSTGRARLALAAVALGIGRAAVETALETLRASKAASQSEEKPHWVLADVATEIEAARLLTYQAAQSLSEGEAATQIAMARLIAAQAAQHAVDAALRIVGPDALREGTLLERLARDVRAVALLFGTEEDHRAQAADGLLQPLGE